MRLEEQINATLKEAMIARDDIRKRTLRMLKAAITMAKKATANHDLSDQDILVLIGKQIKQRQDAIIEYSKAGREDLAQAEREELQVLQKFMPEQLTEKEIRERAKAVIAEVGAKSLADFGKVMKALMADLRGQADGRLVNKVVRPLLTHDQK